MGRITRMFYEKKSAKSAQSAFGFWISTVENKLKGYVSLPAQVPQALVSDPFDRLRVNFGSEESHFQPKFWL